MATKLSQGDWCHPHISNHQLGSAIAVLALLEMHRLPGSPLPLAPESGCYVGLAWLPSEKSVDAAQVDLCHQENVLEFAPRRQQLLC